MNRWKQKQEKAVSSGRWQKTGQSQSVNALDRALQTFTDLMIEKIKTLNQDWKKPWFSPETSRMPENINGRHYNGSNSLILMLVAEKKGYDIPVWATYDRIDSLNYRNIADGRQRKTDETGNETPFIHVKSGEKSVPVTLTTFTVVNPETKEKIKYEDYKNLSDTEREKYNVFPKLNVFYVFNIASQTNLQEVSPELYDKFKSKFIMEAGAVRENISHPAIDKMIDDNLWLCPIRQVHGDDAYYSISKDEIVIPERSQFIDGESFASNTLHECSHSLGAENRLNQLLPSSFGSKEYAIEELRAELTAAVVSSQWGLTKHVKDDSAAYLRSWLDSLQENPDFIKNVLSDVKRRTSIMNQRINAIDIQIQRGQAADYSAIKNNQDIYRQTELVQDNQNDEKSKDDNLDIREEEEESVSVDEDGDMVVTASETLDADKKQGDSEDHTNETDKKYMRSR